MPLGRKIRYGMVGGGPGAFIGEVHRKAAALDGEIELVAGAFSSGFGALSAEQATNPKQSMDSEMRYIGFIRDSLVGHLINALIAQKQISLFTAFQERKKGVRSIRLSPNRSFHATFIPPRLFLLTIHGLPRAIRCIH